MYTVDELFELAISKLKDSPYTIVKETQNHGKDGGGKVVKFYKATHQQAAANTCGNMIFYGTRPQAKIYLKGMIDVFSELETVVRGSNIPQPDQTYFNTQAEASDYAINRAKLKYAKVQEIGELNFQPITAGQSARYHLELSNDSTLKPEMLHIIIYRMESGKYELTHYIN